MVERPARQPAQRRRRQDRRSAPARVVNSYKVAKHFELEIADGRFAYQRKTDQIHRRGRARRPLRDPHHLHRRTGSSAAATVRAYKQLKMAERAFRTMKDHDRDPPDPPPPRRPRPRPRLPLHARLLRRLRAAPSASRRCCSPTRRRSHRPTPSPPPSAHPPPRPRPAARTRPTATPPTASPTCSPNSARSAATSSASATPSTPSPASPTPPNSKPEPSNCSTSSSTQ